VLRFHQAKTDRLLGIPEDSDWQFDATIPIGKPFGHWGLAKRPLVHVQRVLRTTGRMGSERTV